MSASSFEVIDNKTFRVGEKVVSYHFSESPSDGEYRYYAEGTSDEKNRYMQHLFVHDFREVRPCDLPNSIWIYIDSPKSDFRQVRHAEIRKLNDQSDILIDLGIDYFDWHLPVNLQIFSLRYRDALLCDMDGVIESSIDESEYGLNITCNISVPSGTDYMSAYRKAITQILTTYRKCLEDIYKQPAPKVPKPAQGDDTGGAKWWFRYVIVPVLGSGAIAAIAASLIALRK